MKYSADLVLDHRSFNAWVKEVLPVVEKMTPAKSPDWLNDSKATKIMVGDRVFYTRELPMITERRGFKTPLTLDTFYGGKKGSVRWDGPVTIPILAKPDGGPNGKVWMSLTPMEIFSQRQGLRHARGEVLVGGLGMGWFAQRVLEKASVKHVIVADLDKDTLEFFGKPLLEKFGSKLTLVNEDVYSVAAASKFDACLLDIWPMFDDCAYDRKFLKLASEHSNAWAWGTGWRSRVAEMSESSFASRGRVCTHDDDGIFLGALGGKLPIFESLNGPGLELRMAKSKSARAR